MFIFYIKLLLRITLIHSNFDIGAIDHSLENIFSYQGIVEERQKYFTGADTILNTKYGMYFKTIECLKYFEKELNNGYTYVINSKQATIINNIKQKCTTYTNEHLTTFNNINEHQMPRPYGKPNFFQQKYNDADIAKILIVPDTLIRKSNCFGIKLIYRDDGESSNQSVEYFIDKIDTLLVQKVFKVEFQGMHQYVQKDYLNRSKNFRTDQHVFDYEYHINEDIECVEHVPYVALQPFENGSQLPNITLYDMQGDSTMLQDEIHQVTILDLYYNSCYPCIKSIPTLKNLKELYGDKIRIISMNPFNDVDEMLPFLDKYDLPYEHHYSIKRKDTYRLNIETFPGFYIVDKHNTVLDSYLGYQEDKTEHYFANKLDALLSEN